MTKSILFCTFHMLALLIVGANCQRNRKNNNDDFNFAGLYPSAFTPIDEIGNINVSVIPAYAEYLQQCGVDGVVVGDVGGEGPSLSLQEKKKLFGAWIIAGKPKGLRIIGVVGFTSAPDTKELALYAETIGMDALFVYPQPIIEPSTPELLTDSLEQLTKHVTTLPIFYNDCPDLTGLDIHMPTFFRLASERIPQFKGVVVEVKIAVTIIALNKLRNDQNIFISNSIAAGGGTLMGFDAFNLIVLNVFPRLIQDIIKLTESGDVERAREEQRRLNTLVQTIIAQGHFIAALKATMEIVTGLPMGWARYPVQPISKEGLQNIEDILVECGIDIYKK